MATRGGCNFVNFFKDKIEILFKHKFDFFSNKFIYIRFHHSFCGDNRQIRTFYSTEKPGSTAFETETFETERSETKFISADFTHII